MRVRDPNLYNKYIGMLQQRRIDMHESNKKLCDNKLRIKFIHELDFLCQRYMMR